MENILLFILQKTKYTPLNNKIRTADEFSTKLPVTDLNIAPKKGAVSNLRRYKNIKKLLLNVYNVLYYFT